MAEPTRKDVKRPFFFAWLAICVALIVLVWADNLGPGETAPQPGFVRSTAPVAQATATVRPTTTPEPGPIETQDVTDDQ